MAGRRDTDETDNLSVKQSGNVDVVGVEGIGQPPFGIGGCADPVPEHIRRDGVGKWRRGLRGLPGGSKSARKPGRRLT